MKTTAKQSTPKNSQTARQMNELKARHIVDVYDSYYAENPFGERSQVYLKSEADKVIADLEESHKMEVEQLLLEIAELKSQYNDMDVTHTVHIAKMNALIEELEESQRWRKCSEELPDDGAEVLATDGDEIWLCNKDTVCDGSPWFQTDGLPHIEGVTHWMPLPATPKEDK